MSKSDAQLYISINITIVGLLFLHSNTHSPVFYNVKGVPNLIRKSTFATQLFLSHSSVKNNKKYYPDTHRHIPTQLTYQKSTNYLNN